MKKNSLLIFVCKHGAAKSIIAATYFNKLAQERNLDLYSIARGTNPDSELSPKTISGLLKDGLSPIQPAPQKLTLQEAESAQRIVTFCELPAQYQNDTTIEQWEDVPPVSENYEKARDVILEKLNQVLK